jgi:hypothetical protein
MVKRIRDFDTKIAPKVTAFLAAKNTPPYIRTSNNAECD